MDLSKYNNSHYYPGAGKFKRLTWYVVNAIFFNSWLFPVSKIKCSMLRLFGAVVGTGVVIKPRVNIKYPWNLDVGNNVWIGEGVWIDSLAKVVVGSNVCISQEAFLLTGNHDYKDPHFGLMVKSINISDSAWIGAKAIVCPGSVISKGSILTAGSIFSGCTEENKIYQGNPAKLIRERKYSS
ncbi:MAG: WcaF family extracellular polysaccharide biosynthesis acetyltransferase [Methylococcales bacterium]